MSIQKNYNPCKLCPRNCGVNRLAGETGFCGEDSQLRICAVLLHCGEEPPLTGQNGSGTVFISGCNLGCALCQNYQISQGEGTVKSLGRIVSTEGFAEICMTLRDKGAENINIVTGSHVIPAIAEGLIAARNAETQLHDNQRMPGFQRMPVLWNSSAYETPEALELLRDHVDIFLPDLKTLDSGIAGRFYGAYNYPQTAAAAILKMIEMVEAANDTAVEKKVIIRHLILPGCLESTRGVLRWFADNAKDRARLSLMTQYTPIPGRDSTMPKRYLHESEYNTVLLWLEEFGIEDGFCQELVTGSDWLPDFRRYNPFSSKLSVPVWHFSC